MGGGAAKDRSFGPATTLEEAQREGCPRGSPMIPNPDAPWSWAFRDHRTMAEVMAAERRSALQGAA